MCDVTDHLYPVRYRYRFGHQGLYRGHPWRAWATPWRLWQQVLLLGILEAFSISVVPLAFQDAIAIAMLLVILFVRPHGIFGSNEAASLKEF